jgi:hypothetical protein
MNEFSTLYHDVDRGSCIKGKTVDIQRRRQRRRISNYARDRRKVCLKQLLCCCWRRLDRESEKGRDVVPFRARRWLLLLLLCCIALLLLPLTETTEQKKGSDIKLNIRVSLISVVFPLSCSWSGL